MILLFAALVTFAADSTPQSRALASIVAEFESVRETEDLAKRVRTGQPIEHLPDLSAARVEQGATRARALLRRVDALAPAGLSKDEWITSRALRWQLVQSVEVARFQWFSFASVTSYQTPLTLVTQILASRPLATEADAARYLALMDEVPPLVDTLQGGLEARRAKSIVLPREELRLIIPIVRSFAQTGDASSFVPVNARLGALTQAARERLLADVTTRVRERIAPAFEKFAGWLDGPYRATASDRVGASQYSGGDAYYRWLVRSHTTLEVTPEQVHKTGLVEVARLDSMMAAVRKDLGFTGTKAEFHERLRHDPRFFAKTPEEVGERLMRHDARIRPRIGEYFKRVPRAQGDVRRLDPRLEGAMTFGYYQVPSAADSMGHYNFNGSQLDQRSLVNAAALVYHELVPGHHFQINLQSENDSLPRFRRDGDYTAFVEGWGDYASGLAGEMGMYSDPYDRYGRLLMDMFISCRLVVDTGMNFYGWPRERAIAFMRENTLESDTQLDTETLRYSVDMPGQALAYKMGSLELLHLREWARARLGAKFDIARFHEFVLSGGALPLAVERLRVERWVEGQKD